MASSKRVAQINELILRTLALTLAQGTVKDPGVYGVTLTSVKVSPDLQTAKVYFTVLGSETQRLDAGKALKRAAGFLHQKIRDALQIRIAPRLSFYYDDTLDQAMNVRSLLTKLKTEEELNQTVTTEPSSEDAPPYG